MNVRRFMVALLAAVAVYFAIQFIFGRLFGGGTTPPPAAQQGPDWGQVAPPAETPATQPALGPGPATQPAAQAEFIAGRSLDPVTIGGDGALRVVLSPRGAAIDSLYLTEKTPKGRYRFRESVKSEEPYRLLEPLSGVDTVERSYETHQIWLHELNDRNWRLDGLVWNVAEATPDRVRFTTELRSADQTPLRLSKTYSLVEGTRPDGSTGDVPLIQLTLAVENSSSQPATVIIEQDGPLGIVKEGQATEMRRLLVAKFDNGVQLKAKPMHGDLKKAADRNETVTLAGPADRHFLWTALTNKYFGAFTRVIGEEGRPATFVQSVLGLAATPQNTHGGDLLARMIFAPQRLAPGEKREYSFEIYAGAKDDDNLGAVNPAFVNSGQIGYSLVQGADMTCACTFYPLPQIMTGLLELLHYAVRNYGVAIIFVVLIVRTLLHPLAVFQQKSMYRMQEAMGRVQPKMEVLKEKYANDKVKLNQEMMKLWSEENVNPAASMIAMVPLFIQMPILVALWTALNADVNLRHAAFDGWWITDLSAPDALIKFPGNGLTIPVLAWLPWIGSWFTNIPSLNLLPILMGVSMFLQQKYMPKPAMQARMEAAKKQPPKASAGGMTAEEQMRQQQMVANMMSIMFPIMFYYMPSGLTLYWMATNVYGICESLIIRRQLNREKIRRELEGPKPKKPSWISRFFKKMAEQAEELQRKADQVTEQSRKPNKPDKRDDKGGSKKPA